MSETIKTLVYAAAAALSLSVAWFVNRPVVISDSIEDDLKKPFFADFKDPLAAKSLEIQDFNASTAEPVSFKVAQVNGVWSLPSNQNYPADAERQLVEAASSLVDVEKVGHVTDDVRQHELYGVVDPDPKTLKPGAKGVGKKVTLLDADNNRLASYIVGAADENNPDLRFVRVPGQDRVYRAKLNIDKLSTKFEDWIEKDLMKMNPLDVSQLVINDYNVDELNGVVNVRGDYTFGFNSQDSKWSLVDRRVVDTASKQMASVPLTSDEEVNQQKLNDLKNALGELRIIDVARKPAGLSADLRADLEQFSNEAKLSLAEKGFFVVKTPIGGAQIYSNEGEVRCGLSTGVEYTLRFGGVTDQGGEQAGDSDAESSGANRYVFITAAFNQDLIPKPVILPLPELPGATEEPATSANPPAATEPSASEPAASETPTPEEAAARAEEQNGGGGAQEPDAATAAETEPMATEPTAAAEAPSATSEPAASEDAPAAPSEEEIARERRRIDDDNKRNQREYDEKVEEGRATAKALTDRFADWYFVISDATYQKIRLRGADLITKKPPPEIEAAPGLPTSIDAPAAPATVTP